MRKEYIFEVEFPAVASAEQRQEWIEYRLGYRSDISIGNPLSDFDLEVDWVQER